MKSKLLGCTLFVFFGVTAAVPKDNLQELLARIDLAAMGFRAMTATVNYITHTAVIDDDTKESGTVVMKKISAGEVQARVEFLAPDLKSVLFEGRKAQIFTPKTKELNVVDLGDKGEQIDRFVMLGFGTSSSELAHDYAMRVVGAETLQGQKCTKLELVPKGTDAQKLVAKIEIWIPDAPATAYPLQEKVYEKSPGDYRVTLYSDLVINPKLSSDALKLKLPSGYKTIHPQK